MMTTLELMEAFIGNSRWPGHNSHVWCAAIKATEWVIVQMRYGESQFRQYGHQGKHEVFHALVAGRCWRDAAWVVWEEQNEDLGCSSGTESMADNLATIIRRFAEEDQAARDLAMVE